MRINLLLLLVITSSFVYPKNADNLSNLSDAKLSYNEVLSFIESKENSFHDKYWLSKEYLSAKEKNEIWQRLQQAAKKESDKQYLVMLYCDLYTLPKNELDTTNYKLYLDSAYTFVDKISSNDALGIFYYTLGAYYNKNTNEADAERLQLEYLYKSIPHLEQSDHSYYKLLNVYNLMTFIYITKADYTSAKKTLDEMDALKIGSSDLEKAYLYYKYEAKQLYYSGLKTRVIPPIAPWDTTKYYSYSDSAIYFLNKSAEVCISELKSGTPLISAKHLLAECYINLALEQSLKYTMHPDKKWDETFDNLEKGKSHLDSTYYKGWLNYYFTKGRIYQGLNKFKEANDEYSKAIDIVQQNPQIDAADFHYLRLYKQMVVVNGKQENYKDALVYQIMYSNVQENHYTAQRYKTSKELGIKYETAKKDLEISLLNERQQALLYDRMLIITISIIVIILLILIILYFRIKKQQREREAILKDKKMEEKEYEYQILLKETETTRMRHYLNGLEAERSRLAKELHDNIANELYVATLKLDNLNIIDPAITTTMKDLHNQIRNVSHDLMPPQFQYTSLLEILYNHLIIIEKQSKIKFELLVDNETELELVSSALSHEIYRIIQECTGNIIKHSLATTATIRLSLMDDGKIEINVVDDGIGFDTSKTNNGGIGLHIIRKRCKSLGGKVNIESMINEGYKITAIIPIDGSEK